jgi:hypothetical protein
MANKIRFFSITLIFACLFSYSILPASAVKPINCGKPIVPSKSRPIQNVMCSSGAPNLGVKSSLKSQSPKVMSFSKSPSGATMLNAVCSDLKLATDNYRTQLNIPMAVTYQIFALNLKVEDYYGLLLILMDGTQRADFEVNKCSNGLFVGSKNNGVSEAQRAAQELVTKNTALQDSCYFTRTSNGDNPTYARQLCIARFPNSLQWALSINHSNEESCYDTRVFNGDNEINARNICLSRYPIRN